MNLGLELAAGVLGQVGQVWPHLVVDRVVGPERKLACLDDEVGAAIAVEVADDDPAKGLDVLDNIVQVNVVLEVELDRVVEAPDLEQAPLGAVS